MSDLNFRDCAAQINNDDLDAAEVSMGVILPSKLREHYLLQNGGVPDKTCYPFEGDLYSVRWFFPIKYGVPTRTLEATYARVADAIPAGLIPFTNDGGGNLYCYSVKQPTMHSICYWDHEMSDEPDEAITVLAPSLKAFLEALIKHPYL